GRCGNHAPAMPVYMKVHPSDCNDRLFNFVVTDENDHAPAVPVYMKVHPSDCNDRFFNFVVTDENDHAPAVPVIQMEVIKMPEGNGFVMKDSEKLAGSKDSLPGVDFSTFILSLYSSALVQLGEMEDPASGTKTQNLGLAKQSVDMIIMLEKKTRGNLDKDEANLMKSLLHELRLAYVKAKG
ncbi:MAG: DUF1844 domain-containing protein, partial [Thermodesulfobacteriota bacterium]|nr:DUF1844 domain-containing protein [Thermodesulfobacteriota bacterium]